MHRHGPHGLAFTYPIKTSDDARALHNVVSESPKPKKVRVETLCAVLAEELGRNNSDETMGTEYPGEPLIQGMYDSEITSKAYRVDLNSR